MEHLSYCYEIGLVTKNMVFDEDVGVEMILENEKQREIKNLKKVRLLTTGRRIVALIQYQTTVSNGATK